MTGKDISSVGGGSSSPSLTRLDTETVQIGDTLADIAQRLGTTEEELLQANPNFSKNIQPGQEIRLPDTQAKTTTKSQFESPRDVMEKSTAPSLLDEMLKPGTGVQIPGGQSIPGTELAVHAFMFGGPGIALGYAHLNDEQQKAYNQLEKSPGWDGIAEYQRMQIRKNFSKLSGDKLNNEVTKTQEKIGSIQTLKTHGAWKDLGTEQQNKVSDQILKSPGTNLPQDTADMQKKLDSMQTLKGHKGWNALDSKQRERVSDTIFKSPPKNVAQETGDLQKKFDAVQTLSGHTAWKKLDPSLQQKVSDQMLKTPAGKLPQETADVQKKFDSVETVAGHNAWKNLAPAQQQKVADQLLKSPVGKLPQETADIQKRLDAVQTLSGHNAWKELQPEQKQKVSDQLLKLSGDQLKQKTTQLQKEFDSIEKMTQHDAWKTLGPDQKQKLTDPVMTLNGPKLKQHLEQTEKRFDVIKSLTTQPSWKNLLPEDQQKISAQLLKVSDRNLAQTTDNLRGTTDMIGSMRANKVDPEKTLDKLLAIETQGPKAYKKMTTAFTEAQTQINASTDKLKTSTNVRDMLNLSLDRGRGDRNHTDPVDVKSEIFSRFVKQHGKNAADFEEVRTALKDTPAKLLVHWANPEKVGVEFSGGAPIADAALTKLWRDKSIAAGDQSKYKHGLTILTRVEGKLDNVNAWDSGVFSLGIRQWTTHQGSLAEPLKQFQTANPTKFRELLPGVTISGDDVSFNGKSLKESGTRKSKDIVGDLTQSEIVKLSKMMTALGKDPDFQAIQLGESVDRMKQVENMRVGTNNIGSYITRDKSLGHIVDFDPNRPAWVQPSFSEAVSNTAKEFGMTATAPSRTELLAALKDKVEKDPDFQKKIKEKYDDATLNSLKSDSGRAAFLEDRLMEGFKERFISREGSTSHQAGLRARWRNTEDYYSRL